MILFVDVDQQSVFKFSRYFGEPSFFGSVWLLMDVGSFFAPTQTGDYRLHGRRFCADYLETARWLPKVDVEFCFFFELSLYTLVVLMVGGGEDCVYLTATISFCLISLFVWSLLVCFHLTPCMFVSESGHLKISTTSFVNWANSVMRLYKLNLTFEQWFSGESGLFAGL